MRERGIDSAQKFGFIAEDPTFEKRLKEKDQCAKPPMSIKEKDDQRCKLLSSEYCMAMVHAVGEEAASRQNDTAPVSKHTQRIVSHLLNSDCGEGCMVLVRVTEQKFGKLIAKQLRDCRNRLGLQQKFAVVLDMDEKNVRGRGGLRALLATDSLDSKKKEHWVERLRRLNGWDNEMHRLSEQIKKEKNPDAKRALAAELESWESKPE